MVKLLKFSTQFYFLPIIGTFKLCNNQSYAQKHCQPISVHNKGTVKSLRLKHPQGVGIVGTLGLVGKDRIEFCHTEPRPTTPRAFVDI